MDEEDDDAVMQDEVGWLFWSTKWPDMEIDGEVAAYTEHLAALTELEDISKDESFGWSDFEDGEEEKFLSLVTEKVPSCY
ncbi:hypothetical protein M378DRAFT_13810 [Amanita muscaria Koide BX008]|uniref:Uncharacterized protein n=1 Tax=Amanita muscaria (strain Koide BX008) TaxID=946122 RepID=A0A0C2WXE2_AMAMK|nr:hypothetical protein M378DRAFT_13810 [Amanita muscaria Koide BX008]